MGDNKKEEKSMKSALSPYSFIPMLEGEAKQDISSIEEVPAFNVSQEGTLTGHIEYDLKVTSNLHVGAESGKKTEDDTKKQNNGPRPFFRNGNGKFAIPGSTMRGFVRSHAELLSGSYPDSITDETFLYRKFASKCKKVRDEYSDRMKSEQRRENAKENQKKSGNKDALPSVMQVPDDVKAGWIVNKNGKYSIIPVQEFGATGTTFFRIHEADLRKANKLAENQYMYTTQIDRNDKNAPDDRDANLDYRPYRGVKTKFSYDRTSQKLSLCGSDEEGVLLNSGWIHGKKHHYLVSAAKASGNGSIAVDLNLAVSYMDDYKRNCIQNKKLEDEADFYALPEEGEEKLFFYKVKKIDGKDKLVGFGPTPYFRIYFDHRAKDGITVTEGSGLDYAKAIFGYAEEKVSLKGRVFFENCVADSVPTTRNISLTLSGPKATSFPMYVNQIDDDQSDKLLPVDELHTYNMNPFRLNGYKFYWKRSKAIESMDEVAKPTENQKSGEEQNTKIQSKLQVVLATPKKPVAFHGRIDFENLKPDELGLVLMSLRLQNESEPESYLIGSGKPYGMGKVSLVNIHLYCMDQKERFRLVNPVETDCTDEIETYKQMFISEMGEGYTKSDMYTTYLGVARQDNADTYLDQYNGKLSWSKDKNQHVVYMPLDSKTKDVPDYKSCLPLEPARKVMERLSNPLQDAVVTDVTRQNNDKGYCVYVRLADGTENVRCYQDKNIKDFKDITKIANLEKGDKIKLRVKYIKSNTPKKSDRIMASEWWINK